jgi:hypothetical protein
MRKSRQLSAISRQQRQVQRGVEGRIDDLTFNVPLLVWRTSSIFAEG